MNNQRTNIQNALVAQAKAYAFKAVTYDAAGAASIDAAAATVASCFANETDASFSPNLRQGRREAQSRDAWTFELHIKTNIETSFYEFEQTLQDPVQWIDNCKIELQRAVYTHPVQGQPSGGSSARFIIRAIPRRA